MDALGLCATHQGSIVEREGHDETLLLAPNKSPTRLRAILST